MIFRMSRTAIKRTIIVLVLFMLFNSFLILRGRIRFQHEVPKHFNILLTYNQLQQSTNDDFTKANAVKTILSNITKHSINNSIQTAPASNNFNISGIVNYLQFRYLIQEKDVCTRIHPNLNILIYVHSSPSNNIFRDVIRHTWGGPKVAKKLGILTLFFMGNVLNLNLSSAVQVESQLHHDIIQEDFIDSYHNLSYKAIAALRWITNYCPKVKYIVKVDDDMFVNVFSLTRFLKKVALREAPFPSTFFCAVWYDMPVERNLSSRWFVSKQEYSEKVFPTYCSGSAYIMPRKIIPHLYSATFTSPFIWVDDVYITGFLARTANISHENIMHYYVFAKEKYKKVLVNGDGIFGHFIGLQQTKYRILFWNQIEQIENI